MVLKEARLTVKIGGGGDERMRVVFVEEGARDISKKNNIKIHAHEFRSLISFCALDIKRKSMRKVSSWDGTFELLVKRPGRPCFYT